MREDQERTDRSGEQVCPIDEGGIPGCGSSLGTRLRFVFGELRDLGRAHHDSDRPRPANDNDNTGKE